MNKRRFGSIDVELSNTDKELFPRDGITKGRLIDYYARIADTMLPHIAGRPLTLHRFPDGIAGAGFYQQERPAHFPVWVEGVRVTRAKDPQRAEIEHVLANGQATLAYLANQGTITLHGWLSRVPHLDHPDRMVIDLDPSGDDFATVRTAARRVRALLQDFEFSPYLMSTGSRGLHVVTPLAATDSFNDVRRFARGMMSRLAHRYPADLTIEQRKHKRGGRLYLDVSRNAYGQTTVAPYAVRARPGAPVAVPLDWDELGRSDLGPDSYTVRNVFRRLARKRDPWRGMDRHARALGEARRAPGNGSGHG